MTLPAQTTLEACFIEGPNGRLCLTGIGPAEGPGQPLLIIPPFAEEMNCSRRFMAQLARQLAGLGMHCWILDLSGTGDSDGTFETVRLHQWHGDISAARDVVAGSVGRTPALLGIRFGALLAAAHASANAPLLMIQPILQGADMISRFLRLRVVASMTQARRESVEELRRRSQRGERLVIAGYPLSPDFRQDLEQIELADIKVPATTPIYWYETTRSAAQDMHERLPPPKDWPVAVKRLVRAEPFWAIQETTVPEALCAAVSEDVCALVTA